MENEQTFVGLGQQLNRYIHQIESEVGKSGKTLHQISSEYLSLKTELQDLARELEPLIIADADSLTSEQLQNQFNTLQTLQIKRDSVLESLKSSQGHPWKFFAHPDHQTEDFDLLLRTVRFVLIQLSKFWIEIQSFPLFLNTLSHASLSDVEHLLGWLKSSPSWNELITQPRLVPLLTQPSVRNLVFDFARDIKSTRALREKASAYQSALYLGPTTIQTSLELLTEGMALVQKYKISNYAKAELEITIANYHKETMKVRTVREFFSELTIQSGFPKVAKFEETGPVFLAKKAITQVPKKLLPWRQAQILQNNQLIRLQAIQDRARPLQAAKQKIETFFHSHPAPTSAHLRKLATSLTSGGILRRFKAPYKEALKIYRGLLKNHLDSNECLKESPLQMSDRLNEWASWIEQKTSFEQNPETIRIFGPLFKGIDTDFNTAIEANQWATSIRHQLNGEAAPIREALLEFMFQSEEKNLDKVALSLNSAEAMAIQEILNGSDYPAGESFTELESKLTIKVNELTRLFTILSQLGIAADIPFSFLTDLGRINEDLIFLFTQIESNTDLKTLLKGVHRGLDTDLSVIEQCAAYVNAIETADIPETLKTTCLLTSGPQKFGEKTRLVEPALSSLLALRELLQKLEHISHGQSAAAVELPVPTLLACIQNALKQPGLLNDWVEYLRAEREARVCGLGAFLDFFENREILNFPMIEAYKLAVDGSLLKQMFKYPPKQT